MEAGNAQRDFDEGTEIFCRRCGDVVVRYYLKGPNEGKETAHVCRCELKSHAETCMPAAVRAAVIRPEHASSPLLGMFDKSAVVRGSLLDVLSVVKLWWYRNNVYGTKYVLRTNDAQLRDVGSGDYAKRQRSEDYAGPVFNTIDDFVLPPSLLIVELGVIKTGTKDGAYYQGKLFESIYTRYCSAKPMWILIQSGSSFSKSYYPHVWSREAEELLSGLPVVECMAERTSVPASPPPRPVIEPEPAEPPRRPAKKKVRSSDEADGSLSVYGSGVGKSQSFRKDRE